MPQISLTQRILYNSDTDIIAWSSSFIVDRKASGLSKRTIEFYEQKLKLFLDYCTAQMVYDFTQITPTFIRQFLLHLEDNGHNPGGIHAVYRTIRAYFNWWENESEPDNWTNPMSRVRAPKLPSGPLAPVSMDTIKALINTCDDTFLGLRDRAIILCLLDSGARAMEFLSIDINDFDIIHGIIQIKHGKGNKSRLVCLGKNSRHALRKYLKLRRDKCPALWTTIHQNRLNYQGLRQIIAKRARLANVPYPSIHGFRRAFALACLRNGMDIYSLQMLMGHSDLSVLKKYLALTNVDIIAAHGQSSPVDNW